jgi:hypothetical protein
MLTLAKSSLIAFLLASSVMKGEEDGEEMEYHSQEENVGKMSEGYNAPCRIKVDRSYDFFVSGSFIYWQPIQENMKLGVVSNSAANPNDIINGYEADLSFKYKPGFKVGIGMDFDYDSWDTFIEYTWFHGTEKREVNLDPNDITIGLLPAWQVPNFLAPQYNFGSEEWKLKMDLLDWDLGRSYSVGKQLCIHPFIGLRSAWISQNVYIKYVNTNPAYAFIWPSTFITQTIHSWGIGPRIGLASHWKLGKGFRIYGNGEGDILFTKYNLNSNQISATAGASGYTIWQHSSYLRTHLDLKLGVGWGIYLADHKCHLDFSADYGFQVFFNQNMFRRTISAQSLGVSTLPNGNLYLSGLTITACCHF